LCGFAAEPMGLAGGAETAAGCRDHSPELPANRQSADGAQATPADVLHSCLAGLSLRQPGFPKQRH